MARIRRPNLKYVSGLNKVLGKLEKAQDAIVRRSIELLFFLTAAVHYDFIHRIVKGEVEDMFQLTPNSLCYLLDLKWEKAGHDRLFMYSGEYIKNIQIINHVSDIDDARKKVVTAVIGVTSESHKLALNLEEGFMTAVGDKTYFVPPRPLWERYGKFVKRILTARDFNFLEDSEWMDEFKTYYKDMAAVIKDDLTTRGRKSNPFKIISQEKRTIRELIASDYPHYGTPNDLVGIALRHKEDMSDKAWRNILRKFKEKVSEGKFPKSIIGRLEGASGTSPNDEMEPPSTDIYLSSTID